MSIKIAGAPYTLLYVDDVAGSAAKIAAFFGVEPIHNEATFALFIVGAASSASGGSATFVRRQRSGRVLPSSLWPSKAARRRWMQPSSRLRRSS